MLMLMLMWCTVKLAGSGDVASSPRETQKFDSMCFLTNGVTCQFEAGMSGLQPNEDVSVFLPSPLSRCALEAWFRSRSQRKRKYLDIIFRGTEQPDSDEQWQRRVVASAGFPSRAGLVVSFKVAKVV
jgi:hypothetical protein